MKINKQDTNGVKALLAIGELGYDNYPSGGDVGRVYVGNGVSNIALAKKSEIDTKVVANANITAGTATKVTYDTKGLITAGTALSAGDIPVLDAGKITTGTLPVVIGGTGVTTSTGTGNNVLSTSPTLVTPNIGVATATSISSTGAISGVGIISTGNTGFKNDAYVLNSRNPIWSFGNALTYGISYYQASAGIGNKDTIAFDFGTNTSAAAKFYVTSDGDIAVSGSISSNGVIIGTLAEFTAALG